MRVAFNTMTTTNPPSGNFITRKPFLISMAAIVLLCGGLLAFKLVRDNTTLSFSFLLDGKPLSVGMTPTVKVDGLPFTSGCTIAPGSHELTAELPNAESFALHVRVLYGNKNLGTLPLESSKGSLLVSVNPSPASVFVRRGIEAIGNGDAPFTLEKLPFGDYDLEIKRGEYKETRSVKIQGKPRTEAKIDLNLGGVTLSSVPAIAEFDLSGNGRQWQGKLPMQIDDVPVGDYSVVIHRGEYEERHSVNIQRQQLTETKIELNLGIVSLSSDPADAEYDLSGNGRHWQGKLPMRIDDVPGGNYSFLARRMGWEFSANVSVGRGLTATNKMEFPYGSIEVSSEPTGLVVSTNGVAIGKTPLTLQELKPGQYALSVTDGENDLMTNVIIAPREAAKPVFAFHYGAVQLSTTPAGATVFRKGKDVGKTPLTLDRIPAGETTVELRLQDYVSTNLSIHAVEGITTNSSVKLISEHYLQAMKQAREAFGAAQFTESSKFITTALESEPNDSEAMKLRDEVSQAAAKAEEALRAEQADAKARMLASLTSLDFQQVIANCTDTKQIQVPVEKVNISYETYRDYDGKYKQREVKSAPYTVMETQTESTFNDATFAANYIGKTYKFDSAGWKIAKIEKDGTIVFRTSGSRNSLQFGQDEIRAIPSAANQGEFLSVKNTQRITIKARVRSHDRGDLFSRVLQRISLEDAELLDK